MIFAKGCKGVCTNAKNEMIHSTELSSFKSNTQDTCSACFRIGHCHLQACEDYNKAKQEESRLEQTDQQNVRKEEADVS